MRARLARPRRIVRGRLVAPVAAAAAVALVGGMVVAAPDAPTVRGGVQTVALTVPAGNAGAGFSFNFSAALGAGELAGVQITDITGLPAGLTYNGNGVISGNAAAGVYTVTVIGTRNDQPVQVPVTLTINNADGTAPAGLEAGSAAAVEGSLGGEAQAEARAGAQAGAQAGGQLTTGSDGTDAILGAVLGIVTSLGGDAGSAAELAAGSTGQGGMTPGEDGTPETPTGPLSSLAGGPIDLGSLTGDSPELLPVVDSPEVPDSGSLDLPGSSTTAGGEVTGETTGGLDTQSLGPLGSLLDTGGQTGSTTNGTTGGDLTTGGQISIPGSTTTGDTGSLGNLAPGLALTGAALLGLAGLSLILGGGSSTPGSSALLPALPGSTTNGGGTTTGGSSGSTAPTVAAGAPKPVQAPGPTVANGRG
ncbi:hypothetical protein [Dietzia sp. UBA5065]|uniref:hypothetical protein n=1 Tax=Dietzia sp. UBA5065 TaxID=1946422 RepID=UPI0025C23AE5|nr:hypothetical protein [Dietzia sp. UBA5065]HMT48788.1 hypothetical protein [Dietzia sp.]